MSYLEASEYHVGQKVLFYGNEIEETAMVHSIKPFQLRLSNGHIEDVLDICEVRPKD